uniref:Uncharacterized protein n=1 Tax=Setaria viridis TaxID=4556 RepID=A0A4U6TN12_SETVI|nr:hypothetical protein SEVIR_7G011500v2 [Setaria viridis]
MADWVGKEGLIRELASGFRLLMDPSRGLITFDSLRYNASLLGLGAMSDDDLRGLRDPELMDEPRRWLDNIVAQASRFLFTG